MKAGVRPGATLGKKMVYSYAPFPIYDTPKLEFDVQPTEVGPSFPVFTDGLIAEWYNLLK